MDSSRHAAAHLQLQQLQRVGLRNGGELIIRVQRAPQALQGGERAQHEREGGREAEGLVQRNREQVLADARHSRLLLHLFRQPAVLNPF